MFNRIRIKYKIELINVLIFYSKDWYKGQLTDAQLDALENPPTKKTTPKPAGTFVSRRRPQRKGQKVQEPEE